MTTPTKPWSPALLVAHSGGNAGIYSTRAPLPARRLQPDTGNVPSGPARPLCLTSTAPACPPRTERSDSEKSLYP